MARKEKKKVATNLPVDILEQAVALTGLNQTEAIIAGLKELIRREKLKGFLELEGKVDLNYDVSSLRERKSP